MKINILQGAFLPVPPIKGGAIEAAWFNLGKEFVREGHEVCHISRLDEGLQKNEDIAGVKHQRIKGAKAINNPWILKALELPYVLRARRIMSPADILVTHAFWAPILFPRQEYGVQYIHVGRYPKGQLRLYKKAARLQVPSKAIEEACEQEASSMSSKIKTLPYPLTWDVPPEVDFESKEKVVLYAGRIHPEKGVMSLCEAWNRLPGEIAKGWTLRILGPWKQEEGGGGIFFKNKLLNLISKGNNKIELCNPIFDRTELKEVMIKAKYFIYPSQAILGETFGLSVLEAMSCGCVPIVSSLPCFQDFIRSGIEGIILDANHSNPALEIEKELQAILQLSMGEYKRFSTAAWTKAKEYSVSKVAEKYLRDFRSLL